MHFVYHLHKIGISIRSFEIRNESMGPIDDEIIEETSERSVFFITFHINQVSKNNLKLAELSFA